MIALQQVTLFSDLWGHPVHCGRLLFAHQASALGRHLVDDTAGSWCKSVKRQMDFFVCYRPHAFFYGCKSRVEKN